MKFKLKLLLILLTSGLMNYGLYLLLLNFTQLDRDSLSAIRTVTGVCIAYSLVGYLTKDKIKETEEKEQ